MRYRNQQARRGAATAGAAALLLVLWTATGASADQGTPSAGTVAKAKAKVSAVASQVGVMQAQLAVAQGKLQALGQAVDAAGEAYNGAMYKLQQAQAAAAAAQRAAANAGLRVAAARRDVGIIASAVYRNSGSDLGLGALISASSPENALSDVSILGVLANRQSGIMDRMRASQVVAQVLDRQAADALANVNRAAAAAAAAKAAVEAKVAAQASQVTALNAQVAQLNTALAAARAQSTQLTHARAVGLARAAAARAAALKAARAAAARKHNHGSSGGSSGGTGSGGQATSAGAAAAIAFAKAQLGDPYQWGATGPSTWDCSGLTMRAWAAGGVTLPHWSVAQWAASVPVSEANARPGDLVFFAYSSSDYHSIHHVALYLGGGLMIEAPFTGSWVRISRVSDQPGLFGYARP